MDKHKDPDVAGCLEFDYEELKSATHNFDQRPASQGGCKLGEGGFGPVFKGKLKFTEVAIKILRNTPKVTLYICHRPPHETTSCVVYQYVKFREGLAWETPQFSYIIMTL